MRRHASHALLTVVCTGVFAGFGSPLTEHASAADIHVGPGQSIQAAIQSAVTGDRILVQPGTYPEAIDFVGKSLELIGVGGSGVTILDASGLNRTTVTLSINTFATRIAGISIRGGVGTLTTVGFVPPFYAGGGVYAPTQSACVIEDCEIAFNSTLGQGGGVQSSDLLGTGAPADVTLRNCDIHDNTASVDGGGVWGRTKMEDCDVHHNSARWGGGYFATGAFFSFASSSSATRSTFRNNTATSGAGGAYGRLLFTQGCRFDNNVVLNGPGGGLFLDSVFSDSVLVPVYRCEFFGNSATTLGGGLYTRQPIVESCVFAGNSAPLADGAHVAYSLSGAAGLVRGTTFYGDGLAFENSSGPNVVADCIAWNVAMPFVGVTSVTYCDIQGGGYPGVGNINVDPQFVNAGALDFRLSPTSPCIDAGEVSFTSPHIAPLKDFEGEPRKFGGFVDIGGDEFSGDCNANGIFDYQEILAGAADCNGNAIPDTCEAGDCDGNGINDTCESADCNGNGIRDICDIIGGTSLDLDHNGVPDECHGILLVPTQFATIQAAINAAVDGNTVLVEDGVYSGTGNIQLKLLGKKILVASANGPARCTILGGGSARAFTFNSAAENNQTVIRGFTISQFSATQGGATQGGAVTCVLASAPLFRECVFLGNTASTTGGAVHVNSGASPTFIRCVFANNTAPAGGAISTSMGSMTLENCTLIGNVGTSSIVSLQSTGTSRISSSVLWGNTLTSGTPIVLTGSSALSIDHSDVQGGQAAVTVNTGSLTYAADNFAFDPQLVDIATFDIHLRSTSPCRDNGTGTAVTDFEGDATVGPIDVGADEFAAHLYTTGQKTPGGTLSIQLVSPPGAAPQLYFASATQTATGLQTPYGVFALGFPLLAVSPIVLPASPPDGVLVLPATLPPSTPPLTLYAQAYAGGAINSFTNLDVIVIQ